VCVKPQGNWPVNAHDRMMLGDGTADGHSLVVALRRSAFEATSPKWRIPRSMAPYRSGICIFTAGILAEAVVPVLVARLDTAAHAELRKVWSS
jgi:hypothetical protein